MTVSYHICVVPYGISICKTFCYLNFWIREQLFVLNIFSFITIWMAVLVFFLSIFVSCHTEVPLAWIWRSSGCLSLLHKIWWQWCVQILKDFFVVINCYWSLLFLINWSRFTSQWLVMKSGNVCPNNHLDGFIIERNLTWIPFHWRDNCKSLCKQESLTFLLYKQGRIQRLCWRGGGGLSYGAIFSIIDGTNCSPKAVLACRSVNLVFHFI